MHVTTRCRLLVPAVALWLFVYGAVVVGVTIERLITLGRSAAQSRRFAEAAIKPIETWDFEALAKLADQHQQSTLARVFGAVAVRFSRAMSDVESGVNPVELARNEAERRREQAGFDLRRGLGILASIGSIYGKDNAKYRTLVGFGFHFNPSAVNVNHS